jgi:hypothetical protein
MNVRVSVDDTAMQAGFDRLLDTGAATAALEKILSAQFQAGQQAVHVVTGSLRASEEIDSDYTAGRWAGQVSFGGASPGFPNDPVVYAGYEAARGGPHDFGEPIAALYPRYRTAMREHLSKGGRA